MSQIDSRIALGVQAPVFENRMTQMAQMDQMMARRFQMEELQEKRNDNAMMKQYMAASGGDLDAASQMMLKGGQVTGGLALRKAVFEGKKAEMDVTKTQGEIGDAGLKRAASQVAAVKTRLGSFMNTPGAGPQQLLESITQMAASGEIDPKMADQYRAMVPQDPAAIPQFLQTAMQQTLTSEQAIAQRQKEREFGETLRHNNTTERLTERGQNIGRGNAEIGAGKPATGSWILDGATNEYVWRSNVDPSAPARVGGDSALPPSVTGGGSVAPPIPGAGAGGSAAPPVTRTPAGVPPPGAGAPTKINAWLEAEGITDPKFMDLARSIYTQESNGGRNTKTSNHGAVGGMQIIPGTFAGVADKGWDINNPEHSGRAGIRELARLYKLTGGDPGMTSIGYYGGEGAIDAARRGVPYRDKKNPEAPNTFKYRDDTLARMPGGGAAQPTVLPSQPPVATVNAPAPGGIKGPPTKTEIAERGRATDSQESLAVITDARKLLEAGPTGSGIGSAVDRGLGFIGATTEGAKLASQLKILGNKLVMKVPRMEGPQGEKDLLSYQEAAGKIGDDTLHPTVRLAALDTMEGLERKYLKDRGIAPTTPERPASGKTPASNDGWKVVEVK